MNLSFSSKLKIVIPTTFTTLGLFTFSNLVCNNTALAFSVNGSNGLVNTGFESNIGGGTNPTNGWSTIGDVTTIGASVVKAETIINNAVQSNINIDPIADDGQAIITNAYNVNSTRVDDVETLAEGEMGPAAPLNFNQSTINPVDADTDPNNHEGEDLQTFLGLDTNELSIARKPEIAGELRTSKEGSGMYQTFTIDISEADVLSGNNAFEISFNWAYLTNDGLVDDFGNQDYSFFTLYDQDPLTDDTFEVLGDSNQTEIDNASVADTYNYGNTTFYQSGSLYTTKVSGLEAKEYTYVLGFGVVDIDGSGRSSALVLDNLGIKQVPFEFTPATGIGIVLGFIGLNKLRRRSKK